MLASGCIGTISIGNGITFDGCQPIDTAWGNRQGAIESFNTQGIRVPYLVMTGDPYFGMRFSAVRGLALGRITMNLNTGLGIRFDRDGGAQLSCQHGHHPRHWSWKPCC